MDMQRESSAFRTFDNEVVPPRYADAVGFSSIKQKGTIPTTIRSSTQNEIEDSVRKMQSQVQILMEDMEWVKEGIRHIIQTLEDSSIEEELPDSYDMTPDQIKDLMLEKVQVGEPFYASDIAGKYGLDYDAVVAAIDKLRTEGRINDDV